MTKSLTKAPVSRSPLSLTEKRARDAKRMRRYRIENRGMVESRVVDRHLVEALALHLDKIPRIEAKALLEALFPLTVDSLVHRGHDHDEAKRSIDRRLRGLFGSDDAKPAQGFVRMAAKERESGRKPGGFKRTQ